MSMLERKYCDPAAGPEGGGLRLEPGGLLRGYASVFGRADHGGDVVQPGAFAAALSEGSGRPGGVKMLWQHDPARPVGIWDRLVEDRHGLWVEGRLLETVAQGREARALVAAGVIDGLSIGYRTRRAAKRPGGGRSLLEIELWEVSLVTFPMLPEARLVPACQEALGQEALGQEAKLVAALERAARRMEGPPEESAGEAAGERG